jgi:hypothetical protein
VNATSFRAVGEVRAIRGRSGAGIEFVHLSTGGKDMLADLVGDLAKVQALMNRLKSERREMDAKLLRRELEEGSLRSMRLSERFPFLSTILPADGGEQSQPRKAACANKDAIVEAEPLVIAVDLFG